MDASMDALEFLDPFARLLESACPPEANRSIEAGQDWQGAWAEIAQSGFLDALVPEEQGGAGLSLAGATPLFALIGARAVALPIAETMIARGLLSNAGLSAPDGPIVLATDRAPTQLALVATHALTGEPGTPELIAIVSPEPTGAFHDLNSIIVGATPGLRPLAAILRAQLIAGALAELLNMTASYANERSQFGKPIGRQQAVQQQLAVLAEQAAAARMAAAIGARGGLSPSEGDAATAKYVASRAAVIAAGIAHAVHGAIGISEEFQLQRLTRQLRSWRLSAGSEGYWAERQGANLRRNLGKNDSLARLAVGLSG